MFSCIYFLKDARFLKVGSRIFLRILRLSGVTSRSSSVSMKSSACSRLRILGGVNVSASSAEEERVLVRCFFLQTFNSISSPSDCYILFFFFFNIFHSEFLFLFHTITERPDLLSKLKIFTMRISSQTDIIQMKFSFLIHIFRID